MNVIICVDNKLGTMFNGRRQSRDKILCHKVTTLLKDRRLFLSPYSYELFKDLEANVIQDENFPGVAENDDFCFVEGQELAQVKDKIQSVVLFKWNRDYPSDKKLDIDLSIGWRSIYTEDFAGNSHEKITMEIYERI